MSVEKSEKNQSKKHSANAGTDKKSTSEKREKKPVSKPSKERDKKPARTSNEEQGFLTETAENIEAGAKVVGEKVSEVAEKTADIARDVFNVMKKGWASAYDTGSKVIDQITLTALEYIEKYQHNVEMKKLTEERDRLTVKLGQTTFAIHKMKDIDTDKLLNEKEILGLVNEIDNLDKKIVKIGKKLEKTK